MTWLNYEAHGFCTLDAWLSGLANMLFTKLEEAMTPLCPKVQFSLQGSSILRACAMQYSQ